MMKIYWKSLLKTLPVLFALTLIPLVVWIGWMLSYSDNPASSQHQSHLPMLVSLAVCLWGVGYSTIWFLFYKFESKAWNNSELYLQNENQFLKNKFLEFKNEIEELSITISGNAEFMEETVSSIEEMNSMVKLNSNNASQAAELSSTSKKTADVGVQEIQALIESMKSISQSSKKIEEIIHVIDDIAFQTNLLALNAAVEAARAGEHGKGFAVVADAVRSLAHRSSSAAKDINALIKESVGKVETGAKIAVKSSSVLNDIMTSVTKVSQLNQEISSASVEQSTGLEQISQAMNQLDTSFQKQSESIKKFKSWIENDKNDKTQNTNIEIVSRKVEKKVKKLDDLVSKFSSSSESTSTSVKSTILDPAASIPTTTLSTIQVNIPSSVSASAAELASTPEPSSNKPEPAPATEDLAHKLSLLKRKNSETPINFDQKNQNLKAQEVIPFDDDPPIKLGKVEDF